MLTLSRSVSRGFTGVPPVVKSALSRLVSSKKASHPMPVQVFEGRENQVRCLRFCPDEKKLVTGSSDSTIRILDRTTGAVEVLRGHSGWVQDVNVSQDGNLIDSGSEDKTIRIWNWELGETMHVLEGHERWVDSVQFSPDASRV
ncbi:WD40 repeat-like protein, partial [Paxillus ammoniavirescens]